MGLFLIYYNFVFALLFLIIVCLYFTFVREETEKESKKGDRSIFNWHVGNRMSWIQDPNDEPLTYKLDKFDLPR